MKRPFYISFFALLSLSCTRREPEYLMRELTPEGNPTNVVYSIVKSREDFDTLNSRGKKVSRLSGYFKITEEREGPWRNSYHLGNLWKGKKVGVWQYYSTLQVSLCLKTVTTYDSLGRLHGDYIEYNCQTGRVSEKGYYENNQLQGDYIEYDWKTGKVLEHKRYKNDELHGEQEEYHYNGKLFKKYYYEDGGYVHDYITLTRTGDTLYYENFGADGTGYYKEYDADGELTWEGSYRNKKLEGICKMYELRVLTNKQEDTVKSVILAEYLPYKNDTLTGKYKAEYYYPERTKTYKDSIVGYYKNFAPTGEWKHYYKGKIVQIRTY